LLEASFIFLDPPEPGARARLSVALRVSGNQARTSVAFTIPIEWFDGYRLTGTLPASTVDDAATPGVRRIVVSNLVPGQGSFIAEVVATGERVDPPHVRVLHQSYGELIGEANPPTIAPRPRPGRFLRSGSRAWA
jgi:hypothetical protein